MKSIYIAGPMSGYPNFNFNAFHSAEEEIKNWHVFHPIYNPASKDEEYDLDEEACKTGDHVLVQEKGFNFREAYLWDIQKVIESDAIYMLKGWQYSPGAVGEHAVAIAMKKHFPEYQVIYEE